MTALTHLCRYSGKGAYMNVGRTKSLQLIDNLCHSGINNLVDVILRSFLTQLSKVNLSFWIIE